MARRWWQFSNWPDGRSGSDPNQTGLDPNAVEEWRPDTLPNPCTIWRVEWLNQFVAWKYYLTHQLPTSSTWWLKANNTTDFPMVSPYSSRVGLQSPRFWEWLATLETGGSAMFPDMHMIPLPDSVPGGLLEVTPANNAQRGFTVGQAFAARRFQPYGSGGSWYLDLPLPPTLYQGSRHVTVNNNIHAYGSEMTLLGKNLQVVLTDNEQSETAAENGMFPASFLWQIRNRFDSLAVYSESMASIVEIGDLYGWWYSDSGQWEKHTSSQEPTYPFPSYYDPETGEDVRDTWPYERSGGGVGPIWLHGVGCRWNGGRNRIANNCIVRQIDAYLMTDMNYRYALISMEDPDNFQNPPASIPTPSQYGYCHAAFELPTYIDLDNPGSLIINVQNGGVAGSGWIGTPDPEGEWDDNPDAIFGQRDIQLVSYPYDDLPDVFKGPGWPMTSDGQGAQVPLYPNDRHNRWLDNHQPT